jgi:hypothetical protein
MDMTLTSSKDGNFYGFEYVHPNGSNKRWLNVELIRSSMNQPRLLVRSCANGLKGRRGMATARPIEEREVYDAILKGAKQSIRVSMPG